MEPMEKPLSTADLDQHYKEVPSRDQDHLHTHQHEHTHSTLRIPFTHSHSHRHFHNHHNNQRTGRDDVHEHLEGWGAGHSAKHWPHNTHYKIDKARKESEHNQP